MIRDPETTLYRRLTGVATTGLAIAGGYGVGVIPQHGPQAGLALFAVECACVAYGAASALTLRYAVFGAPLAPYWFRVAYRRSSRRLRLRRRRR